MRLNYHHAAKDPKNFVCRFSLATRLSPSVVESGLSFKRCKTAKCDSIGREMSNPLTSTTDHPDVLTFEVMVTLEDMLALQMRCLATPTMRAGRLRREVTAVLIAAACAPLAMGGGIVIGWAGDRHGSSLGSLFRALIDEPGTLMAVALAMAGCTVVGMVVQRWLRRPWLRRVLRQILRARPDVDPSDPQLVYPARVVVSDEGLESRTGTGVTLVRWNVLKRWEEVGGRLMVLGDAMVGFCVCISAVDPKPLDQFRAVLSARLGPKDR